MDNEMTTEVGMAIGATLVERSYTRVVEIPDGPLPDIDGQPADNWFQHCNFTNEKKLEIISHMPTYDCCICRKNCRGYGNNAEPVREGQCCGRCNVIVIRARILEMRNA
jgi:hypothetical protein